MDSFLVCACCGVSWGVRDDILNDPLLELVGFQVDFTGSSNGYFLFNHMVEECGTTIVLEVDLFADLGSVTRFGENLCGTELCPGRCGRIDDLVRCDKPCRKAWVRELAIIIRDRLPNNRKS